MGDYAMRKLKLLTWNIRQGGKKAIDQIVTSLVVHNADVVVITEFKENQSGKYLINALQRSGWEYHVSSSPPNKENGVLVLSKPRLEQMESTFDEEKGCHRWNEVYLPDLDLYVLGVHVPNINETYDKSFHWKQVLKYADRRMGDNSVILGDFNTAVREEKASAPLKYSKCITTLVANGWADAWKTYNENMLDYTWFSHRNNGFRLDYMFLSPAMANNLVVSYHSHRERIKNFSDHSLLIAEVAFNDE